MASADAYVRDYIARELLKDSEVEIADDRPLIRDGLLNSIGIMKLITFLSDEYQVQFEDEDYTLENFETLRAIRLLVQKRGAAAPAPV